MPPSYRENPTSLTALEAQDTDLLAFIPPMCIASQTQQLSAE